MSGQWILLFVCLAGAWFFSGIETGLVALNRLRLHHLVRRKVPGADILQHFLQNPDLLLGTTLVGTNISVTIASTLAVAMGTDALGASGAWLASAAVTVVLVVFCEYFPKAWFQAFPSHRSLPFAPVLKAARWVLSPVSAPLMGLVRLLTPAPSREEAKSRPLVTREEIVHLAHEGKTTGILTPAEHRMIHEVIELKTKTCREIMTPRERMVYIRQDAPVAELLELARAREINRFPVQDPENKSFVGIVHIFDVLADSSNADKQVRDYMRPCQFVADHAPVDHILPRMRVTRQHMILVTDDRFEVIGLVTLEDVVDEVIGSL
ncbi:MAG: hemolysin family protein [Verrucomicrobia bacterium]|nr:hemolysin family protein [Verrucomicrobiota bacterium]MBU1908949.1 hemolysin family protein [Verrucomicrobiota bacterium]